MSILSDYFCPACDVSFETLVTAPSPDVVACPDCDGPASWQPAAVLGRVKRDEVVRGKYEKPERKTWLDTRELGEGMPLSEWKEKRRKIRDEQRWKEVKGML